MRAKIRMAIKDATINESIIISPGGIIDRYVFLYRAITHRTPYVSLIIIIYLFFLLYLYMSPATFSSYLCVSFALFFSADKQHASPIFRKPYATFIRLIKCTFRASGVRSPPTITRGSITIVHRMTVLVILVGITNEV